MGGFAGIKNKSFADSDQEEEIKRVKKAIYERITKNFNVFEFLDKKEEEGDDEFTSENLNLDSSDEN